MTLFIRSLNRSIQDEIRSLIRDLFNLDVNMQLLGEQENE